ncbi:MAG: PilZ domain-containing protein [Desulfurobacteriaceae bacterium]
MRSIDFLKFPKAETNTIMAFILIVLAIILFFILAGLIRNYIRTKYLRNSFFKEALERGLTEEEAQILWEYSQKLGRDPFLTLEFKAPFEKVVDLYLREDPSPREELVKEMREKLGFDYVPYFVPITSTKDIELFQPAKLYLPDKSSYEVALFDKDERFMYWAVIDENKRPRGIEGKPVTISFIRKGDGIYKFEGIVESTFIDNGKYILKIPHTFELTRYQRREHARVEVEIPVRFGFYNKVQEEMVWTDGEIVDISAGGAKVCISLDKLGIELQPTTEVVLKFKLQDRPLHFKGVIVNVYPRRHANCYGIKFENIKPDDQSFIHNFVKKEQQKLAQLAVRNRG